LLSCFLGPHGPTQQLDLLFLSWNFSLLRIKAFFLWDIWCTQQHWWCTQQLGEWVKLSLYQSLKMKLIKKKKSFFWKKILPNEQFVLPEEPSSGKVIGRTSSGSFVLPEEGFSGRTNCSSGRSSSGSFSGRRFFQKNKAIERSSYQKNLLPKEGIIFYN